MKKSTIYFLFCFLFSFLNIALQAQQVTTVDSLEQLLKKAKEDTVKVNILCQLSDECAEEDILKYAKSALKLAEKLNYKKGIAAACNNIGYANAYSGNPSKALAFFEKSLKIAEEGGDKRQAATLINNMGSTNIAQGNISKGLEFFKRSLKLVEELGDKHEVATLMNNIASVYHDLGDIQQALEWYHKSLKMIEPIGDKKQIAASTNNIASIYLEQGETSKAFESYQKCLKLREEIGDKRGIAHSLYTIGVYYSEQKNLQKALDYYYKSLAIQKEIRYVKGIAESQNAIGSVFESNNDFKSALEWYQQSLMLREEIGNKEGIVGALNSIGNMYLQQQNYSQAEKCCKNSLKIAKEVGFPHLIRDASTILSKVYKLIGDASFVSKNMADAAYNYKFAIEMKDLAKQMVDSINNDQTKKATLKKQLQYEFEKKENIARIEQEKKDIDSAQEKQRLKISILLVSISLLLIGIVIYFRQKWKQQKLMNSKLAKEKEKRIKGIIEATETERKKIAKDLHDSVGALMATTKFSIESVLIKNKSDDLKSELINTSELIDKAASEVRSISHQMASRTLNYFGLIPALEELIEDTLLKVGIKVQFDHPDAQKRFNENIELAIYRVAQEIISNILKHSKASNVRILLTEENGFLKMIFEDNGKGFDFNSSISGLGIENMKSRVNNVNGKFLIASETNETTITIEIPFREI